MTGQEPQAFIDEIRVGAARAVLADLALRAVVAQEGVTASDDELDVEVEQLDERSEQKVTKVRRPRTGVGRWRRYALTSHVERRLSSSWITRASWSTRKGNEIDLSLPVPT